MEFRTFEIDIVVRFAMPDDAIAWKIEICNSPRRIHRNVHGRVALLKGLQDWEDNTILSCKTRTDLLLALGDFQ